ncbi:hypothetical protein A3H26_02475 [candidate division WWE3 bacterium RIFCSPLOWO2_12_FULL_36_10]|uniref:Transglycosylase SLT domain-containing protein n=1 Tax=candidate division WWE3 bacterium RIFCSPLOWO2_12_FULL_36_10 TaxID=1802630 RepID=A0A1F4VJM8_UNCKA|nr:MAG: hypothetical protein A3H26_02475 [candidate division WWE3 bacterium RIFCSPLOWO2_12_FULL_36_10]
MAKRTNAKTIKMYEKNPVLAFARLAFSIILVLVLVFLVVFFVKAKLGISIPVGHAEEIPHQSWAPTLVSAPIQSANVEISFEKTNGRFYWDRDPNLKIPSIEELPLQDQIWCKWTSGGVKFINFSGARDIASPSEDTCIKAITTENMGGVYASLLIGIKITESGSGDGSSSVSYAGALGPMQFMPGTWESNKPWPSANVWEILPSFLAASNKITADGLKDVFTAGRQKFAQQFSCQPRYVGCQVWNGGSDGYHQAEVAYNLAWTLQLKRQEIWRQK